MNFPMPPDKGLGPQVRPFSECFSAETVIKETWFPELLTEREKKQIALRDGAPRQRATAADMLAILKRVDSMCDALSDAGYFNDCRYALWRDVSAIIANAEGTA